jgi:hypothetical protein
MQGTKAGAKAILTVGKGDGGQCGQSNEDLHLGDGRMVGEGEKKKDS